jgi:SSS family solute:Na+ symporter
VVVNDFLKRYILKNWTEKRLVRIGQLASVLALTIGFVCSLLFQDIISAWETMIFVVVTMILVPATFRWHWWRFSAKAFVGSMIASASIIVFQKIAFGHWPASTSLLVVTLVCLAITILIGFLAKPTDKEILCRFYTRIRPFGVWGPIRRLAQDRGLVPKKDRMPSLDALNGLLTAGFQLSLALVPFYCFLRIWNQAINWSIAVFVLGIILYFTWYKNLPLKSEG